MGSSPLFAMGPEAKRGVPWLSTWDQSSSASTLVKGGWCWLELGAAG